MTRFFKQEVEAQVARSPADGVTLAASVKLGALVPLGDVARKGHLRGGPLLPGRRRVSARLRHARRRPPRTSAGPPDAEAAKAAGVLSRDAVGGDIVGSLFVSAQLEPRWRKLRENRGAYGHAFANAGTLVPSPLGGPPAGGAPADLRALADSVRVSLGVGLVFPLPVGNIEVNYVKTARRGELDRAKEGLQVGLAAFGVLILT